MSIYNDAKTIINGTIESCMPDQAVRRALEQIPFDNFKRIFLVAIGKAGYSMAKAASDFLGRRIIKGIVITKYGHAGEDLVNIDCYEAGHPVSDENSYSATQNVLALVENLNTDDLVLFMVSGGGSALFENPIIPNNELEELNRDLLKSGADITEINTIRKRFSAVKGGRFAEVCKPATVEAIVLSDIIGDPLDMIASGPAAADTSTTEDALKIIDKYKIKLSEEAKEKLCIETPKHLNNVHSTITGSVKQLCTKAGEIAAELGYEILYLTDNMDCEAKEAGSFLGSIAKTYADRGPLAIIAGGETVVHISGSGKGGRNQEIALKAAEKIAGLDNILFFSVASDGTDGPTDAAGGIVDGQTMRKLLDRNIEIYKVLENNDAYHALEKVDGLIITGPTGTNVNDFSVVLIQR